MNWTDCKTIPSLLVGTYVCVYLVRVHTDYSWYFPCYTAFGIFKGCRNDFNVVMRGSLKSRTSVPISSFSAISNRQTIFSLNHRALLRQSFHFWTAGLLLGSLNKSNQDFFFLNCWSQAKADSGSYNWQLSINLTMAHKQHSKRIRNSAVHLRCPSKCHANYHVALLLFQKEQQSGLPVLYIPPHLLARELRPAT